MALLVHPGPLAPYIMMGACKFRYVGIGEQDQERSFQQGKASFSVEVFSRKSVVRGIRQVVFLVSIGFFNF